MAETKRTVNVELLGVKMGIKTTQNPTQVERVATLVRNRIENVRKGTGSVDSLRISLLSALDLGRELVDALDELEALREATHERTLALVERLEAETAVETMSEPLPPPKHP